MAVSQRVRSAGWAAPVTATKPRDNSLSSCADVRDRLGLRGWRLAGQRELHLVQRGEHLLGAAHDVEHGRHQGAGHPIPQHDELSAGPHANWRQRGHSGVSAVVEQR
jgi:hypothetical protein